VNPAGHALVFADALLGDHGEVLDGLELSVSWFIPGRPGPRTRLVAAKPSELASVVATLAAEQDTLGVYVGVGLTRGYAAINPKTGRGFDRLSKADVSGLAWLWADIDVAGGGHADSKLPLAADKDTAIAVARSTGLEPTVLVDTGFGIQAHWRLAEPWIFGCVDFTDDGVPIIDPARVEADRKQGERFAWEWVKSLQIRAKRDFGLHVDPTTDTARLVRMPGSYNTKVPGDHREVVVLDVDASRRYDLDAVRAVLAPNTLLEPYRFDMMEITGSLAGVDLPGLFAACRALPGHEPDWLTEVIEGGWVPELEAIWTGFADAKYDNDDSVIDMALAATVLHAGLTPEMAAEAVMCRRLRIGRKVEKVDPARRLDYLLTTIGKCAATLKAQRDAVASHVELIEAAVASMRAEPAPSRLQAVPNLGAESDGPTEVGQQAPDSNADAVTVGADPPATATGGGGDEPPDDPPAPLRVVEEPEPDPHAQHADAPAQPRQGLDGTLPAALPPGLRFQAAEMAAQLGLPGGVTVWTVGIRRLADCDEIRLWLHRTMDSRVHGGRWRPGTVAATRWRPKADWKARGNVTEMLFEDLHLIADVGREWSSGEHGRRRMYELAVPMREGTPEEIVEMAISGLLQEATGTALFSRAVMSRDPWVCDGAVWVPMMGIRDWFRRLGAKVPDMVPMVDLLVDMRCKVVSDMSHPEGNRVVTDAAQWVMVSDDLISEQLAAGVAYRASERDAQDARSDLRGIGE
jgi:hypothetical protein